MFKAWLYFEKSDSLDFEEKVTGKTTLGFLTWYVGFLYFERRPFDVFYCLEIAHLFLQTPSGLKKHQIGFPPDVLELSQFESSSDLEATLGLILVRREL